MEFPRWWVLNSKIFGQKSISTHRKPFYFVNPMNVSSSKILSSCSPDPTTNSETTYLNFHEFVEQLEPSWISEFLISKLVSGSGVQDSNRWCCLLLFHVLKVSICLFPKFRKLGTENIDLFFPKWRSNGTKVLAKVLHSYIFKPTICRLDINLFQMN